MPKQKKNQMLILLRILCLTCVFFVVIFIGATIFPQDSNDYERPLPVIDIPDVSPGLGKIAPTISLELTWPVPDIERMKREGCVADGLLSGYNKPKVDIPLASQSNCYYFHRALETWLSVPDFEEAHEVIEEMNRPDALYSMFIAEAIDTKSDYFYRAENREFEFKEMCKKNSKNFWGEHSCKPSLDEGEYRAYLKQITEDAMDSGIQVFLFGQIRHQEEDYKRPKIDNVIREMRDYAESKDMEIVIGAQTGDIPREDYLKLFDFIDGGIGLTADGSVEDGPCYSRWYKEPGDWCWPLMWHPQFKDKAENVITYLDWNGEIGDDMNTFARMSDEKRHTFLRNIHKQLTDQDVGFMLPLLTPLPHDEVACRGPRKSFYSPSLEYGCKDINVINEILSKQ